MLHQVPQVAEAVEAIRRHWTLTPQAAIVLGSGLGQFAHEVDVQARIGYEAIPHFPRATAPGHEGALTCGTLCGVPVVVMDGRVHLYEGYSSAESAFGVRVFAALGASLLILSNACGGMNPNFRCGDIMVIEDHVNLSFGNPLVGPHDPAGGLGYPDLARPYDRDLIDAALAIARRENFAAHRGVYLGVCGPNYETRAEYRFFRRIGCDGVGMSTVAEVIVAAQCGLRVLGLSVVTNMCLPDQLQHADARTVISVSESTVPKMRAILRGMLEQKAATH